MNVDLGQKPFDIIMNYCDWVEKQIYDYCMDDTVSKFDQTTAEGQANRAFCLNFIDDTYIPQCTTCAIQIEEYFDANAEYCRTLADKTDMCKCHLKAPLDFDEDIDDDEQGLIESFDEFGETKFLKVMRACAPRPLWGTFNLQR